ncbi:MAG: metal-dependent hydrolase [Planctomycetaceae bacterium]|nr:metal-dependent hydrolase [Planctomycetaceae bacterium]
MRLIFLGTGGYHPNERRQTASLLLPDAGIALDAGTGFFRMPARLATNTLDVFLTHAHLDHICGLTFPLVAMITKQITSLRIHGSASTLSAVKTHLFCRELFPVEPDFEWCPLPESDSASSGVAIGDAVVTWQSLEHPGGSIGYRIDWPEQSLAYITDTTAPGDYSQFVRGVDVLIHECYFPDAMSDWAEKTGHSCSSAVAEVAREAGVKALYLVHADPQHPEDDPIGIEGIRAIFPEAFLAEDLQEIEF